MPAKATGKVALDEMKQRFGSIAGYFSQGLRIDTGGQRVLRAALIES